MTITDKHRAVAERLRDKKLIYAEYGNLDYFLREITKILAEEFPEQGWRDIESAPMDGERILAYGTYSHIEKCVATAEYSKLEKRFICEPYQPSHENEPEDFNVTHWMPLPAPPKEGV